VGQAFQIIAQLVPVRAPESWVSAVRRVSRKLLVGAGLARRDGRPISVAPVSEQWLWEQEKISARQGDQR
jgi:hypothetical protein